jgi:hypothetical protein
MGLRRKQYCVLNKQYSKEEYEKLIPKIITHMQKTGEWGEFFPASLSLFGYNETIAYEHFPLLKENALSAGFNWSDYASPPPVANKVITKKEMQKLPDNIQDINEDILDSALTCEISGKLYKIIKPELSFYKKHNLPLPKRCPDQRHADRMALRCPRKLWERNCFKCKKTIQTTYAPDRPEIVYCEDCYLKEVY